MAKTDPEAAPGEAVKRISVIIPTLNEERRIGRALSSLASQNYPQESIEVLVVDGGSQDSTQQVAASFQSSLDLKVLDNSRQQHAEAGKTIGLLAASGECVLFLDADAWLLDQQSLRHAVRPLAYDTTLAGSILPYHYDPCLPLWSRYLSLDEFQRDPLLETLTPNIGQFITERHPHYLVCTFKSHRIPPIGGTTIYRREDIDPTRWGGHFRDVDHPVWLAKQGKTRFSYVPQAGIIHEHCQTLRSLLRKRLRNFLGQEGSYLGFQGQRDFVWFEADSTLERLKMVGWILSTNMIVPRFAEGVYDCWRHGRWEALLRPIAALAVTDTLLAATFATRRGRHFLRSTLRNGNRS